jgi:5-methylcytosine-specific restriction endonuclease McrA
VKFPKLRKLLHTLSGFVKFPKPRPWKFTDKKYPSDILLRKFLTRRDYYRDVYLKSDAWQRKRYVVLKRDNWRCVYCGAPADQVHHKRYADNIGNEPIEWLVSICHSCHDDIHH